MVSTKEKMYFTRVKNGGPSKKHVVKTLVVG